MQLSYELTLAEFKSALRLHFRQKLSRRIHWFIYKFVIPGTTGVALSVTLYLYVTTGLDGLDDLVIADIALVAIIILVFIFRGFRVRSMFRALYPPGAKNRITSIAINDEDIRTSVDGVGEGRYLWTGVSAYAENKLIALFYIGDERFLMLPTRILSSAQRAELNDLIERHVVKM